MYYKEEIINGILCYKFTPNGEFKPLTAEELTKRILELKDELYQKSEEIECLLDRIDNFEN